jgi:hypothetical protein
MVVCSSEDRNAKRAVAPPTTSNPKAKANFFMELDLQLKLCISIFHDLHKVDDSELKNIEQLMRSYPSLSR